MKAFLRRILSIFLGLLAGAVIMLLFEYLDHRLHPFPTGYDPSDTEAEVRFFASLPAGAFLIVLAGWVLGTIAGVWVAVRIENESQRAGIVVGGLFLAGAILNSFALPHPLWFVVVGLLSFLPATYLGAKLGAMRKA